jgi:RNA-dependent RNA polymerase
MGSLGSENKLVITQVSIGGFDEHVTAKMLFDYLEDSVGTGWRCRLKTSSTPPESYPEFHIDTANIQKSEYEKVKPHAFVHFVSSDAVKVAMDKANQGELILVNDPLKVNLGPESPYRMNQRRSKLDPFKFTDIRVEIGVSVSKDEFFVGWRGPTSGVDFVVDPFDGKCKFLFTRDVAFSLTGTGKRVVIKCNFKVEFVVREINEICQYLDTLRPVISLQLNSAPMIYYRTADDDMFDSVPFDLLDDDDPWIRTTDFTPSGAIGRCNTYRISILPRHGIKLKKALAYLKEQRVFIDERKHKIQVKDEPEYGNKLQDLFFSIHYKERVPFKILFLVNVIVHKGIINQHQLSEDFFNLLRKQEEEVSMTALKHICSYKRPIQDACRKMKNVLQWLLKNPKFVEKPRELADITEIRRLIITPTKAYCLPPETELSNRVLRNYRHVADRFLRVSFMDEGMKMLTKNMLMYYPPNIVYDISKNFNSQKTTMFRRVRNVLSQGFYLCGRKYSFLAYSANQLRDRSAWFFAEGEGIAVLDIISWMGKFTNKNVAKCAARMGQCFSSTYATIEVPSSQVNSKLTDIERGIYNFSDGIGKMSPDLAMEVAERLNLKTTPPCAYQIRYAGCKGVIASWPVEEGGPRLSLRPSMNKFESKHTVLEICSWTRLQPGFLNRQIITLLSALDVRDGVFWNMQEEMISNLNKMMSDADVAFDVITASCADQGDTAAIMLSAGFEPRAEPHLRGMLNSIRVSQLGDLREKARIFVPSGRWLLGCLDELAILEQGQCFIQVSNNSIENSFAKHGSKFSETRTNLEVIKGFVVIAKNPCLHPGDIRVLEAVDKPELHHLFDCLVFPQKGERPHSNEASGSDLDGDLYFVTWDQNLVPPSKQSWPPMEYTAAEAKPSMRDVQLKDIIEFFSKSIVNENLGSICNAHVVHADISECGAMDPKCLKLAEMAALAVDFPKTGKIVNLPYELKPKLYPDFMGKEDFQSYKSEKILGKLYRQIKDFSNEDPSDYSEITILPEEIPYDRNLEVLGSDPFMDDAWALKISYDVQLSALLGQYKVNREEEIVTGHVWSMPKYSSKKQGELKERLKNAYNVLKREYRKVFDELGADLDGIGEEKRNEMYEKKASAWYQVSYHPNWVKKWTDLHEADSLAESVMLSFPWIAADYLARIKIKSRGNYGNANSKKPIDSLAKYLVDRM